MVKLVSLTNPVLKKLLLICNLEIGGNKNDELDDDVVRPFRIGPESQNEDMRKEINDLKKMMMDLQQMVTRVLVPQYKFHIRLYVTME